MYIHTDQPLMVKYCMAKRYKMLKMKLKNVRADGAGTPTCAACCATVSVLVDSVWTASLSAGRRASGATGAVNTESGCVCVNNIMHAYTVHCTCPTFTPLVGTLTPPKHIHIRHGSGNGELSGFGTFISLLEESHSVNSTL